MNAAFSAVPASVPWLHGRSRPVLTARRARKRPAMCKEEVVAPVAAGGASRVPRVFGAAVGPSSADANQAVSPSAPIRAFGAGIGESAPLIAEPKAVAPRPKTKTRIRQHLNPLAARWRGAVEVGADWYARAFAAPEQPLVVDVGCGKGRFVERLALSDSTRNFLGLEIRAPLVEEGNARAQAKELRNLAFLACNANVSLRHVLDRAPSGALDIVLLQFCDPWFKKRHAKRRMVDVALVEVVHDALRLSSVARPGHRAVFLQSDVLPLAEEMRAYFDRHPGFVRDENEQWSPNGWVAQGPFADKTEREICVERREEPVYRAMYTLARYGWERCLKPVEEAAGRTEDDDSGCGEDEVMDIFED